MGGHDVVGVTVFAVPSDAITSVMVGSEGQISIRENEGIIRVLDPAQARDLAKALTDGAALADERIAAAKAAKAP
jgi:hypothetical protein